jgi:predicted RNA binding protein YcfA (HicA-like mRNA interferase family)
VTWGEVVRKLKAAGYQELRHGKGSHLLLVHRGTHRRILVSVHTKKDAGQLGNKILKEAGIS